MRFLVNKKCAESAARMLVTLSDDASKEFPLMGARYDAGKNECEFSIMKDVWNEIFAFTQEDATGNGYGACRMTVENDLHCGISIPLETRSLVCLKYGSDGEARFSAMRLRDE